MWGNGRLTPKVSRSQEVIEGGWSQHRRSNVLVSAQPAHVTSVSALSGTQRVQYVALVSGFAVALAFFWVWWLQPGQRGNPVLYALMTLCIAYQAAILPGFYAFFLGQMRHPVPVPAAPGSRVAMISLTVPGSESLDVVRRQLHAMMQVEYPHDSYILVDKVHSPEIRALAVELGVRYFSRHDRETWGNLVDHWNQPEAPFKARTKAGNVNAWLDAMRRSDIAYDYFAQLDIDHLPNPDYLDRVLGYFDTPEVAWVQAPSVYGNLNDWTARGSAEQELVLQGPLQSGFFGFSGTPFIIGSHSTYRMRAVREIGGFQPTRAEDHLDTVMLAAQGYRGVFVPEVLATGDGPETFEIYLGQQFAWAYSMITVLFHYTPRLLRRYTLRQSLQFLFAQTWYTIWSVTLCTMFCLPAVALLTKQSISNTPLVDFLAHSVPQGVLVAVIWWWSRRWFQPAGVMLSWRGIVLHIARWPVVLSALIQVLLRVHKPYMITPKGVQSGSNRPLPLAPFVPYFLLIALSLAASGYFLATGGDTGVQGNLLFTLHGALTLLCVLAVVVANDRITLRAEGVRFLRWVRLRRSPIALTLTCGIALGIMGILSFDSVASAFVYRSDTDASSATAAVAALPVASPTRPIPTATSVRTIAVAPPPEGSDRSASGVIATVPPPPTLRPQSAALATPSMTATVVALPAPRAVTLTVTAPPPRVVPIVTVPSGGIPIPAATSPAAAPAVPPAEVLPPRIVAPTASVLSPRIVVPTTTVRPGGATPTPRALPVVALPANRAFLGIYDDIGAPFGQVTLDVGHTFVDWEDSAAITRGVAEARQRQRVPLLTIEPWHSDGGGRSVVTDTARGTNDAIIRANARVIRAQAPQLVLVRFAHEMELVGNYPWSVANATEYIQAYRHYVDLFQAEGVTNVRWVWSPAGNADAPRYYPGDAYVDYVGTSILGYKAWDVRFGADDAVPFHELFGGKYSTLARFGKPIIIAELGVASDTKAEQAQWLRDALADLPKYPLLAGVVYFNAVNAANQWAGDTPDWRVTPDILWQPDDLPQRSFVRR